MPGKQRLIGREFLKGNQVQNPSIKASDTFIFLHSANGIDTALILREKNIQFE